MTDNVEFSLTWELDSLHPHPETDEFSAILEAYRSDLGALASDSEELPAIEAGAAQAWAGFLERWADLFARTEDLHAFVGCHAAADAENKLFQKLEGALTALGPQREQILTNLELALRDADDQQLQEMIAADERLQAVRFYLEDSARNAAFRLPKEQELLTAELAVDAIHAWGRLYDRLSGELRIEVMEKGDLVRKSVGQVQFDMPERSVRQNNFYAADKAWQGIADTCADALNHISGTRLTIFAEILTAFGPLETRESPAGEKTTLETYPEWPLRVVSSWPCFGSQIQQVF